MSKLVVSFVSMFFFLGAAAEAAPILTGVYGTAVTGTDLNDSRETGAGGGLQGNADYSLGFTVTWDIVFNGMSGLFDYSYVFTGLDGKDISHITVDLSDDCLDGNEGFDDPACVTNAKLDGVLIAGGDIETGDKDGVPGGVKFDVGSGEGATYTFSSNRAPVWGHLGVKSGGGPGTCADFAGAGNTSIACNDALLGLGDANDVLHFVARPNGVSASEPGTLALLGLGLLGLGFAGRRR